MSSKPKFTFFTFPGEVRDMIYQHYVTVQGGYVFNFDSNKLTAAQPIDLALMYMCKRVAQEMRGLALQTNTITFSTLYSDELRIRAGRFHDVINSKYHDKPAMLHATSSLIPKDKLEQLGRQHPEYRPILGLNNGEFYFDPDWNEIPSVYYEAVTACLRLAAVNPGYTAAALEWIDSVDPRVPLAILSLSCDPWDFPTTLEIDDMVKELVPEQLPSDHWDEADRTKYRFSAAAAAIQFLHSIPHNTRIHIRNILLLEDYVAVAFPECHAKGLIPFCRENLHLRIERRANLWRNISLKGFVNHNLGDLLLRPPGSPFSFVTIQTDSIVRNMAIWIAEALDLCRAGMPPNSFSLLLDGDPLPTESSELFQNFVQRSAIRQASADESESRNLFPTPGDREYYISSRFFEGFPQAIQDIVYKSSCIRCNFDLDESWDVKQIIEERRRWGENRDWEVSIVSGQDIETSPPLPKFRDLLAENVIPLLSEDAAKPKVYHG